MVPTPSPSMMTSANHGERNGGSIIPAQDDNGDVDRSSYELEHDRVVARLKELMRPMEQASKTL